MPLRLQTFEDAVAHFGDEDIAFVAARDRRWPRGVVCPLCGSKRVRFMDSRKKWNCNGCRKQFSTKTGTIFEDSPLSFTKWLPVIWLVEHDVHTVSTYDIQRALGITQKSAWFMLHRIRAAKDEGQMKSLFQTKPPIEAPESPPPATKPVPVAPKPTPVAAKPVRVTVKTEVSPKSIFAEAQALTQVWKQRFSSKKP